MPSLAAAHEVAIVGAGLAGLACAHDLHRAEVGYRLFEAEEAVGGRVRTDVVDGYRLDRGFQVMLCAYPTTRSLLNLPALAPRRFFHGAFVHRDRRLYRLADPFRHPLSAVDSLRTPLTRLSDVPALGRLLRRVRGSIPQLLRRPEVTSEQALREAGISEELLDGFFRPFFGGVFLDRALRTSSRMLDFVMRMFVKGPVVVPERGMQAIPDQLAAQLDPDRIRLDAPVTAVAPGRLEVLGDEVRARCVVLATDGVTAAGLAPQVRKPDSCACTTLYFAAAEAPVAEPVLILDGEGEGPVNTVAMMSNVSPAYAPGADCLISASIVGAPAAEDHLLERQVRVQLSGWFGAPVSDWRHLRTYRVEHALPAQPPGWIEPPQRAIALDDGLLVCGDHRETASIESAIRTGRQAARECLRQLGRA